ncbi:DegT/DnrJ/EryC1/StrS family aminotransferase [Paenibacillus larvae]
MNHVKVPFFQLNDEWSEIGDALQTAVLNVLRSGTFILGPEVEAFEAAAAAYLGVKYAVGVNSGTDALLIALKASGIGEGDEVITPSFTFFATAEAISQAGAVPVFADIEPGYFSLDPDKVKKAITPRTKAILPVHLFGAPADMNEIMKIAADNGLFVIEDAAQAFGLKLGTGMAGTFGDVGCYSFFPTKNLGAYGDGGLLVTSREDMAAAARMLRTHGAAHKYYNEMLGYNSRLDEIQAAILRVKLPFVDEWNRMRRVAAVRYSSLFEGVEHIRAPFVSEDEFHIFHQYTVRVLQGKRDKAKKALADAGIGSMIYYETSVHLLPVYNHAAVSSLPHTERASREVLSLPLWPHIPEEIQEQVVKVLRGL